MKRSANKKTGKWAAAGATASVGFGGALGQLNEIVCRVIGVSL
jgi:hypothetical protein